MVEFGGYISLNKDWAKSMLRQTQLRSSIRARQAFAGDRNYSHLAELIFIWDQTGINLVPASNWTMEVKGSKRVEVAELTDKITY